MPDQTMTRPMAAMELLLNRASIGSLAAPAPDQAALDAMFASAVRAPDHGRLRPWHFLVVQEAQRARFGEVLAQSLARREPEATEPMLERERAKALRAPMIIVAATRLQESRKVPAVEQRASTAAAVQNILLAAHALGYGAVWKTGGAAYDPLVRAALGFGEDTEISGFIYLGTPAGEPSPARRPAAAEHVSVWAG
jgi:nitroreductase